MGCITSQSSNPGSLYSSKSITIDCASAQNKNRIRKAIEKDNLIELAIILEQQKIPLQAEISDSRSRWMMIHFCCRWDSDNCLQYLLKNYFIVKPIAYIQYVNAHTAEGSTPLHLCATWKSQKCLNILNYYGGINLITKDKSNKTPYECAIQSRFQKMVGLMRSYKELNISFTVVQTQKLVSGSVISENQVERKPIDFKVQKRTQTSQRQISDEQKRLLEDKKHIQTQVQQMLQKKMEKQFECTQQKVQMAKKSQNTQMKYEQQKIQKEMQRKYDEQLRSQRQKYETQLKIKQAQLQKLKNQLRQIEQRRINQQKIQAQKLAQKFAMEKQQQLKQLNKNKEEIIQKLKKTESMNQPTINKANEKQMKQQNPSPSKNTKSALQQSFKQLKEEVPSQLEQLYQKAIKEEAFVDSKFPAEIRSIGNENNQNFNYFKDIITWLRPKQIFGEEEQFKLFEGIDPNDVQQGELGVCYMLATISALAVKPENIQKIFVFADTKVGFYVLRLYINGSPTFMVIDDQIPCNINTNYPIFTQPVGSQLWVMLMEKCWAKAIGSYLSAEGMVPDQMMEDISGAPGFGGWFNDPQSGISTAQHFRILQKHSQLGHTIVLTSGSKKIQGIVNGHAYTLLKVFQIKGKYIFKIRNPWGNFEWQGQYSQKSKMLTAQIKKIIGYTSDDDGIFFVSESQMVKAFQYYSISIVMNTHTYSYSKFKTKKNQNIFYKFTLTKPSYTNVRITQLFDRMIEDQNYKYSSAIFEIGKIEKNNKIKFIGEGDKDTYNGAKSIHFTDNVCEQLQAGEYFVRVSMNWNNQGKYNTGVLSVYATQKVEILPLDKKIGNQLIKQLFYSHTLAIQKEQTEDGYGFYRIDTMKSQFIIMAETEQTGNYVVQIQFVQEELEGVELDIGKTEDLKIRLPLSKDKPAIGTVKIINPSEGGTTGSVYITISQA